MKLLSAFALWMFCLSKASAGMNNISGEHHSLGKLSADTKHEKTVQSNSKGGKPIRLSIKEDLTKLKEAEDRAASEKGTKDKEGSVDIGSGSGDKPTSERPSNEKNEHNRKTTSRKDVEALLCRFMRLMTEAKGDKKDDQVKKAMIWPKKMLPVLKKMFGNKYDGSDESEGSRLPFTDDDGGGDGWKSSSRLIGNGLSDNWDGAGGDANLVGAHHKHRKRKMRRLLKMLRTTMKGRGVGGNWDDDSTSDDGGLRKGSANYVLLKQLLNQMLDGTDRKGVLREMLTAFVNTNGVERNGEEAHEALDELMGRKSLFQFNDMFQNPDQNLGMVSPMAQSESVGMAEGGDPSQAGLDGMIHAQMLSNGAIAPMPNPAALQQTSPIRQAMNTRLPARAQGRGLLINSALPGVLPRPVVAANPRMFMGLNERVANENALQQPQLANDQLLKIKAAEERGIEEDLGAEMVNDSPQRDSYFQPQSTRASYSDTDLVAERTLGLAPSFRSPEQASVISSVTRPEIEDSLQQQPTVRSTNSRLHEGSQFYANHNGLTAALENDSLLRRIGGFRRGKVLKGHNSTMEQTKASPKSQTVKGLSKKTLK